MGVRLALMAVFGERDTTQRDTRFNSDSLTAVSLISLLPFPVLGLDANGTICESNGVLERELGLAHTLEGRTLAESVEKSAGDPVGRELVRNELDNPVVRLTFTGTADPKPRTFYVIRDGASL